MITDEQVKLAANVYLDRPVDYYVANGNMTDMRKALEAYEASKWVKFDVDDESTYPPIDQEVMCKPFNKPTLLLTLTYDAHPKFDGFFFEDARGFYTDIVDIAYWQHLPEFKE